jgi:hypothetical protein
MPILIPRSIFPNDLAAASENMRSVRSGFPNWRKEKFKTNPFTGNSNSPCNTDKDFTCQGFSIIIPAHHSFDRETNAGLTENLNASPLTWNEGKPGMVPAPWGNRTWPLASHTVNINIHRIIFLTLQNYSPRISVQW